MGRWRRRRIKERRIVVWLQVVKLQVVYYLIRCNKTVQEKKKVFKRDEKERDIITV